MRKLLLVPVVIAAILVHHPSGPAAENSITLEGPSTNRGKKYDLKGVFTPKGGGKWEAVFYFTYGRRGAQVFKGSAEGSLQKGALKGTVVERRTFVFSGTWKGQRFSGTTAEYFKPGGKPSATGTIELSRAK